MTTDTEPTPAAADALHDVEETVGQYLMRALFDEVDRVCSRAIIVFADHTEYTDGMNAIKAQADQPSLPLDDVEQQA